MDEVREQECFFPFVSYGTEVDTIQMIHQVLQEGKKKVAVPRVQGEEMTFYRITSLKDLAKGYQGILEPVTQSCMTAAEGVLLLPGLAFDRQKNRVGYGGGYYDRYLARYQTEKLVTVALAFDFQIVDAIEAESFDVRPQWIVTEKGIY
jgi:5-formyltetrahydrofolate cyclo-ligase